MILRPLRMEHLFFAFESLTFLMVVISLETFFGFFFSF